MRYRFKATGSRGVDSLIEGFGEPEPDGVILGLESNDPWRWELHGIVETVDGVDGFEKVRNYLSLICVSDELCDIELTNPCRVCGFDEDMHIAQLIGHGYVSQLNG